MIGKLTWYKPRKIEDDEFKNTITEKINEIIDQVNKKELGIKSSNFMAYPCGCVWYWHKSEMNWFVEWCKLHEEIVH